MFADFCWPVALGAGGEAGVFVGVEKEAIAGFELAEAGLLFGHVNFSKFC